jgi:WD40 repeat protein
MEKVTCVAYSLNQTICAIGYSNGLISLWNTHSWDLLKSIRLMTKPVVCFSFGNSDKWLIVGMEDKFVIIDIETESIVKSYDTHEYGIPQYGALSIDMNSFYGVTDSSVIEWIMQTSQVKAKLLEIEEIISAIVLLIPHSEKILVGTFSDGLYAIEPKLGVVEWRMIVSDPIAPISPNYAKNELFLWVSDGIDVVDLSNGNRLRKLSRDTNDLWGVSANTKNLIATYRSSEDGSDSLVLIDSDTGSVIRIIAKNVQILPYMVFSPDDKLLLTGKADGSVSIWDIDNGNNVTDLTV